jgi:hypothetical protein
MTQFKTIAPAVAIDWTRLARPQADRYDTQVLEKIDRTRGWHPKCTWTANGLHMCAGTVSVSGAPSTISMGDDIIDGMTPHVEEKLQRVDTLLSAWHDGHAMLAEYLDEFWPFHHLQMDEQSYGCASGHQVFDAKHPYHAVYVTVNNPEGCAQGIYHETAHLRLETMGIGIDRHDGRLLENSADELFNSSVRFDKKRPMSAVLHGVYAWLMFTESDYQSHQAGYLTDLQWQILSLHNLPKIARGVDEIAKNARWTDEGNQFVYGLFKWSDDLLNRTHTLAKSIVQDDEYRRLTGEHAR